MATVIRIDHEMCMGAEECIAAAPGSFELNDARQAVVKEGGDHDPERVAEAARRCPNFAISVIEE